MAATPDAAQSAPSQTPAYRMGAMLLAMGAAHFVAPKPFDMIVPAELPGSPRFYTYASGVAELGAGTLLLAPRTRRLGALAAVALFLGVWPANINHVRLFWNKGWPARIGTLARVPMQIPMITSALKIRRNTAVR